MASLGKNTPKLFSQLSPIYRQPLFTLLDNSRKVHREHWAEKEGVQLCRLLSIKTGVVVRTVVTAPKARVTQQG